MLDTLRGAAKSWVAKILIGLLTISFGVFWGIQDVFRAYHSDTLASVGSEKISVQEFNRQFQDALRNYSRQSGQSITPDIARQLGLDRQVLNDLMRGAALDDESRKLDLAVSDKQLAGEIAKEPMFKGLDGQFDPEMFRNTLRTAGITEQAYLQSERRRFLRTAVSASAGEAFTPPVVLVQAAYLHRNEERDARFFVVKASESEIVSPTEDELKKFYDDSPQSYTAPEYRNIVVMAAEPADIAGKIAIDDAALQAGYEKYKLEFATPESRVIEQIVFPTMEEAKKAKDRIAAGEDFMAIAKERGLNETSVSLGDRRKDDIPDDILADAAFALAQGTVSDPIQGKLSIVLLRVPKITPAIQRTFDEVKGELTTRLQLERARDQILDLYNAVEDARAAQTKFEDIAAKAGIPIATVIVDSHGLDKDGKAVEIAHKDEVLQAAFASDVGVENDALQSGDAYVWYEVREVTPSALRPFDQIKDKVKADWIAQKLRDTVVDKAKKLVERAIAGASLDSLAQETGAQIQSVRGLKRNETMEGFNAQTISAVFAAPENGFAYAPQPDGKGAMVIQSQPVFGTPFDAASDEAKTLGKTLSDGVTADLTTMLLSGLQNELGWSVDEKLWSQVVGTANP